MKKAPIDKPLFLTIALLLLGGVLIFASAAFGLLARGQSNISSVVFNHLALGIGAGIILLSVATQIEYRFWRRIAPYAYTAALIATALVFVPHIGSTYLGGRRWIHIASFTFQPSEALKIGSVLIAAAYFSMIRTDVKDLIKGFGGFLAIIALPVTLLILQPDIGTLGVICIAVFAVYWTAGARPSHIALAVCVGIIALGALAFAKPYIRDRVETFFDPATNQSSQGYQIKQSLIAIGSGGMLGRGWGQGVQKFTYLPEPMGDSIFAVAGEELGFVGVLVIIFGYLLFILRGCQIAARAADPFGTFLAIGIVTYLGAEAFINIAAMLGVAPLTGIPLTFISQGGSAMLMSLAAAGVLLSVSRSQKRQLK